MKYLSSYPKNLQEKVKELFEKNELENYLKLKYKNTHSHNNDKALYDYAVSIKNEYFKKQKISKITYDGKINVLNNALGIHTFASRVQGSKLKSKNEIKISNIFKNTPEDFLKMIVIHELSHFKEKEHNKAFYDMCTYIMPNYYQVEFDLRIYLTYFDSMSKIYKN